MFLDGRGATTSPNIPLNIYENMIYTGKKRSYYIDITDLLERYDSQSNRGAAVTVDRILTTSYNAIQSNTMQYNAVQLNAMQYNSAVTRVVCFACAA